jgi:hypothetical protein
LGSASSCGVSRDIAGTRRLDRQNIETRTGDPALLKGVSQRRLIDQTTTRGVDQQCRRLHGAQLGLSNEIILNSSVNPLQV